MTLPPTVSPETIRQSPPPNLSTRPTVSRASDRVSAVTVSTARAPPGSFFSRRRRAPSFSQADPSGSQLTARPPYGVSLSMPSNRSAKAALK